MKNPELFFKKVIKFGPYTVCIEGENNLKIIIAKNNCPKIFFTHETKLKNPNSQESEFYEVDFKCGIKNDVLTVFLFSSREETPIFRMPVSFINAIVDGLEGDWNLIPKEFNSSLMFGFPNINGEFNVQLMARHTDVYIGSCGCGVSINGNCCDTKILSAWAILKNNGIRLSVESENILSLEIIESVKKEIKSCIGQYQRKLARAQDRMSHIPSEKDEPVFLFVEGCYSKAITKDGKELYDSYGSLDCEKRHLEEMMNHMAENFWKYRIVIAQKDNSETISFIDQFISSENNYNKETVSFLKAVKEKWSGKPRPQSWAVVYAD